MTVTAKAKNQTYFFKFNDFEDIIKLSKSFSKRFENNFKNSLYAVNNSYYLIIKTNELNCNLTLFINEYSSLSARGKVLEYILNEHGKCLLKNSALKTISNIF